MKSYSTVQENPDFKIGDELNKRKHSSFGMKPHSLVWGECYLIFLPIFILAIFQATFLPLNLVLLTVLAWVTIRPAKESLIIAFSAGLLLDLAKGTPLGLSSLILLIASFLVILYRRRFDPLHPVFLPIFTLLSAVGYSAMVFRLINWPAGLVLAVFAFLARLFMKSFSTGFDYKGIRLKVS